ncbi:hypothetical protein LXL04_030626 [Taraxacum kok-saghyz]
MICPLWPPLRIIVPPSVPPKPARVSLAAPGPALAGAGCSPRNRTRSAGEPGRAASERGCTWPRQAAKDPTHFQPSSSSSSGHHLAQPCLPPPFSADLIRRRRSSRLAGQAPTHSSIACL